MNRTATLATLALAVIAAVPVASASAASAVVHEQKTIGAYRLSLQIGPAEVMSMHAGGRVGERMLGGKMASCSLPSHAMGGMSMGSSTCNHHLEVHITSRRTGKVVTNARVVIRITNQHNRHSVLVPIMTMVGAGQSRADLHYGNNIYAAAGSYTVMLRVNGVSASFAVRLR